jgi:hypothetical protein
VLRPASVAFSDLSLNGLEVFTFAEQVRNAEFRRRLGESIYLSREIGSGTHKVVTIAPH